jgi:hypothetical protein
VRSAHSAPAPNDRCWSVWVAQGCSGSAKVQSAKSTWAAQVVAPRVPYRWHVSLTLSTAASGGPPPGPRPGRGRRPHRESHRATQAPVQVLGINEAWCQVVALAVDLLAWLRHLTLDGELAKAEPKTLRYRLLHTAGRITHGQRQRWLNIPPTWPWAKALATAFERIQALPAPT